VGIPIPNAIFAAIGLKSLDTKLAHTPYQKESTFSRIHPISSCRKHFH